MRTTRGDHWKTRLARFGERVDAAAETAWASHRSLQQLHMLFQFETKYKEHFVSGGQECDRDYYMYCTSLSLHYLP